MSRVGKRDTAPEMIVRRLLYSLGYRYRLNRRDLPGTPDVVFPARRKVVFVHGCFWHAHSGCVRSKPPKTRKAFWKAKFKRNVERDKRVIGELTDDGWSVVVVWECETNDLLPLQHTLENFLGGR